jgi:hypothetical protein
MELNLARNGMDAEDMKILAAAISGMGTILSVNLLKNSISVDHAKDLVSMLKEHPTLKSLCGNMGNETKLNMSGKMKTAQGMPSCLSQRSSTTGPYRH